MIFENLNLNNYKQIAEIERACFDAEAWTENQLLELINNPTYVFVVAVEEKKVLGYGSYAQVLDEGHINNIAVRKEERKVGIASAILNKFLENAREKGIASFTLEVRESNIAARKLYEKFGFKFEGTRKGFYQDKENALIFWKHI